MSRHCTCVCVCAIWFSASSAFSLRLCVLLLLNIYRFACSFFLSLSPPLHLSTLHWPLCFACKFSRLFLLLRFVCENLIKRKRDLLVQAPTPQQQRWAASSAASSDSDRHFVSFHANAVWRLCRHAYKHRHSNSNRDGHTHTHTNTLSCVYLQSNLSLASWWFSAIAFLLSRHDCSALLEATEQGRRIEIRISLLYPKEGRGRKTYPSKALNH